MRDILLLTIEFPWTNNTFIAYFSIFLHFKTHSFTAYAQTLSFSSFQYQNVSLKTTCSVRSKGRDQYQGDY